MSYTPDTGYFLHSRYHNLSGMETDLKCDFGNQKSAAQTDNLDNPTSASSSNKNTSDNNKMKTKTKEKTAKDAPVKKSAQASSNAPGDPVTAQQAAPGFSDVEIHAASGDNDILSADNQDNGEGTPLMPPTDDLTNKKWVKKHFRSLHFLNNFYHPEPIVTTTFRQRLPFYVLF